MTNGSSVLAKAHAGARGLDDVPELAPFLAGADHVDVKVARASASLREFGAAMLAYQPRWIAALFRVRGALVRPFGLRHPSARPVRALAPEELPAQPGASVGFFRVRLAEEDRLWVGEVDDRHLRGYLAVVADPPEGGARRFRVVTVVHYKNWLGPVYFNAIRPFHHLVVGAMARAGARAARPVHSLA